MKKFFAFLFLASLLVGTASVQKAESQTCITISVNCGDGRGSYSAACGNTTEEIIKEAREIADVICG